MFVCDAIARGRLATNRLRFVLLSLRCNDIVCGLSPSNYPILSPLSTNSRRYSFSFPSQSKDSTLHPFAFFIISQRTPKTKGARKRTKPISKTRHSDNSHSDLKRRTVRLGDSGVQTKVLMVTKREKEKDPRLNQPLTTCTSITVSEEQFLRCG